MVHHRRLSVALVATLAALWAAAPAPAADPTYSGQAAAVKGTVVGQTVDLADTGPVAAGGGSLESSLLCYPGAGCSIDVPDLTNGLLTVQALHGAVVAQNGKSHAESSVASVSVNNVAGNTVSASFLMSNANATCSNSSASSNGGSELAEVVVNGQPVDVTGQPNQRVDLPGGGYVVIDEQSTSGGGNKSSLTVSALHVYIPGPLLGTDTNLYIAQAHADIQCSNGQPSCPTAQKVTGGGWLLNGNARRTFAVAGKELESWGHFLFIDHASGDKLQATSVGPMTFDASGFAVISGFAKVNGAGSYAFTVKVKDVAEPGRDADQLMLSTDYAPFAQPLTTISGGNIQLHTCK